MTMQGLTWCEELDQNVLGAIDDTVKVVCGGGGG